MEKICPRCNSKAYVEKEGNIKIIDCQACGYTGRKVLTPSHG